MTTKTTAQSISDDLDGNGQCWESADGKTIDRLIGAHDHKAIKYADWSIHKFDDGSAIVITDGFWDTLDDNDCDGQGTLWNIEQDWESSHNHWA